MFLNLRILKNLHLSRKNIIFLHTRHLNILKFTFFKKKIFIKNSLTWVRYKNLIFKKKYKYGMFAFTRKPFAKPLKKLTNKKR